MSNLVGAIIAGMKSTISTTLGSTYSELRYIYDMEKNDSRTSKLSFGVKPLAADPAESLLRSFTLDQGFEILLADTVPRTHDDVQREEALVVIYDKADDIFKAMVNTKIGIPGIVLNINGPSLSEPEIFESNTIILVRMGVIVKYRSQLL